MIKENIQKIVEQRLLKLNQYEIAKSYLVHYQERFQNRNAKFRLMVIYQEITHSKSKDFNLKRDNANLDSDTASVKCFNYAQKEANSLQNPF